MNHIRVMGIRFEEHQRFTQWWLWLIVMGACLLPILAILKKQGSGISVLVGILLPLVILFFFWIMRMHTVIDDHGIAMRFKPFTKKYIAWDDVKNFSVINYGFVGGWGIRWGTKYGTVYNVKGNKGLFLQLKSGKTLVVGTSQPDELEKQLTNIDLNNLTV